MGTISKTFTENTRDYASTQFAQWTLTCTENDLAITGSTFQIPKPSLTAKFTASTKNRGNLVITTQFKINSFTGIPFGEVQFARPVTDPTGYSAMTSGTSYNIGILSDTRYTFNTEDFFKASNRTQKTINLYLCNTIIRCMTKNSSNSLSESHYYSTAQSNWNKIATLTLNAPPSCSYSQVYTGSSSNPSTTFYQNLSELKVDITNCIAQYGGDISEVSLTIGTQTVFDSSGESGCTLSMIFQDYGTYTPIIAITDSRGQVTSYNLNPITIIKYQKPGANIIEIERINSSSKLPDDEGTNALLTVKFYFFDSLATLDIPFVMHYNGTSWVQSTCTWYQTRNSTTKALSNAVNWNSPPNTSPVTLYCHVSNSFISTESYDFEVYPYDSIGTGEEDYGTIASATLSPAYYTVDFYAGGHGVAFGAPATDEEFKVAMPATFTSIINIAQDSNDSSDYALCVHNKNAGNFADFSVDWDGKVTARGGLSVPYGTVSISGATTINNTLTVNNNTTIHGNVNIDSGKKYQINGTALQNAVQLVTGGNSTAASISANSYGTVTTTATIPSGYIVVGVARITSNHYSALRMTGFDLDLNGQIVVYYHNASTSNFTDVKVTTQVACIKQVL